MTGDLNAEPHESSISVLMRGESPVSSDPATVATPSTTTESSTLQNDNIGLQFHDLWSLHTDSDLVSSESTTITQTQPADHRGWTFPACDPVKRIDFIFLGQYNNHCHHQTNNSNSSDSHSRSDYSARRTLSDGSYDNQKTDLPLTNAINARIDSVDIVGTLPSADTGIR